MKRALTLALTAVLVLALAPMALAGPKKAPHGPTGPADAGAWFGRNLDLTVKIVEYDPGSGFGQVVLSTSGGSWTFRPEIGDEVVLGVKFGGTAAIRVRQTPHGLWATFDGVEGESQVLGTKTSFETSRVLFTQPGERGFFLDDIIIGVGDSFTFSGVTGLLLPAVQ